MEIHTALWSHWPNENVFHDCLKVEQVRLSEVHRQIVPDSRSSSTEGSVAEVGARPTDEKRKSVSRA